MSSCNAEGQDVKAFKKCLSGAAGKHITGSLSRENTMVPKDNECICCECFLKRHINHLVCPERLKVEVEEWKRKYFREKNKNMELEKKIAYLEELVKDQEKTSSSEEWSKVGKSMDNATSPVRKKTLFDCSKLFNMPNLHSDHNKRVAKMEEDSS